MMAATTPQRKPRDEASESMLETRLRILKEKKKITPLGTKALRIVAEKHGKRVVRVGTTINRGALQLLKTSLGENDDALSEYFVPIVESVSDIPPGYIHMVGLHEIPMGAETNAFVLNRTVVSIADNSVYVDDTPDFKTIYRLLLDCRILYALGNVEWRTKGVLNTMASGPLDTPDAVQPMQTLIKMEGMDITKLGIEEIQKLEIELELEKDSALEEPVIFSTLIERDFNPGKELDVWIRGIISGGHLTMTPFQNDLKLTWSDRDVISQLGGLIDCVEADDESWSASPVRVHIAPLKPDSTDGVVVSFSEV